VTATDSQRPRLLVFNQYYWPGVEATAHLLSELCEALAQDYDVTVVTGRLAGYEDAPDYERRNGVAIVRVHSTAYDRSPLHRRAINYFTYVARALRRGLFSVPRPDIVLSMTDPPMIGDVALVVAKRFRAPFVVISQDVFPEIAVELGRLKNPMFVRLLNVLTCFYLRRADHVVAIGERMKERLAAKAPEARITVIPNWVDTRAITPQPRDNDWAHEHGLGGSFVVMHSGNVGHAQDLDTLIHATTHVRELDNLSVVLIGTGARHADYVALANRLEADKVFFLPYQPREVLAQSLSSADVHFVGLAPGLAGYVVPSRLYGILAAGRPVVAAADDDSETAQVVREVGCGIVIPPGRPDLLAATLRKLAAGHHDLAEMGRRGRAYVEAEADRKIAVERYRRLLGGLARP
jgi:glycosyltransferase involved in cell wall biosynthesis